MDVEMIFMAAEEAQDILATTLNPIDRDQLQDVYKDVSKQIRWGKAIDQAFPLLLDLAEQLIETDGMSKNGCPWYAVSERDQDLFAEGDPKAMSRHHLLLLLLAKKLLGGLKTKVNQSIEDIRILSPEEEDELQRCFDEAEDLEISFREEEEILEGNEDPSEVAASVDISPPGGCRGGGSHARTQVRVKRLNDELFSETYCRDCQKVIQKTTLTQNKQGCVCTNAQWVEGKEGWEAICGSCKKPIEDPSIFDWEAASLEPYGDNPEEDEVIVLCAEY